MAASSAASFEWLSGREAVLLRPDAYVGAVDAVEEEAHVIGADGNACTLTYALSPVLLKIFDEVIVNAIDSTTRDALVSRIACSFDMESGVIVVENDGSGIPIEEFKNTGRMIPSVVFSELHAGSNFKDEETRLTGGRNGVGVSCTNVWSVLFEVSVADGKRHFFQRFRDNLSVQEEAVVSERRTRGGFVKVSFLPDYARLMLNLQESAPVVAQLLRMRCLEAGVCVRSGVQIFFQGEQLPTKPANFLKCLAGAEAAGCEEFGQAEGAGCTVWFALRKQGPDFYGFVNGVRCDGGTLTTHVRERFLKAVTEAVRRKHQVTVRPQTVRDVLALLCVSRVVNPRFTSQAKTVLATPLRQIGFVADPPARLIGKLQKLGVLDEVARRESERELSASLKKTLVPKSRDVLIDKYDAALDCRSRPETCTLILTEGDSAKAFVVAGLSAVGRAKHGIFPLRGVPLNVTNLSVTKMLENKEIANIFRILNVGPNSDGKGMRYGRVAICSDQDSDGSHICGLLINFFVRCLPEVVARQENFIQRIVTPLIRASHKRRTEQRSFFSMQEFRRWEESNDASEWTLKYYKGLGTSSSREAREVFKDLAEHSIALQEDERARETLAMFYDDGKTSERKRLLTTGYDDTAAVDYSQRVCSITSFMLEEHLHFSFYSVFRALPSAVDGLTPSRRKALFFFLSSPRAGEVKVAQAASGVAQKTLYLHGENSLVETIVGLAQDYIGTNNIALLQPLGQFGSRNDKPSIHAAARYIFTRLDPAAQALFPAADFPVLEYRREEGQQVEPTHYVPVLPLLLVNGAQGIGTGFSTCVPSHCVRALCACVRAHLDGEDLPDIPAYFQGFTGPVWQTDRAVLTSGVVQRTGARTWLISELPVGRWTEPFLSELKAFAEGTRSCKGLTILTVTNMSSEFRVKIEVGLGEDCEDVTPEQFSQALRLQTSLSTTHMYAFDGSYTLKLFSSAKDIFLEHAAVRLALYWKRRSHQLEEMRARQEMLQGKIAFIALVVSGELPLRGVPRAELVGLLREKSLPALASKGEAQGYDYLLNLSVGAFTQERISALKEEAEALRVAQEELEGQDASALWRVDLQSFEEAYADYEARLSKRHADEGASVTSSSGKRAAPAARKRGGAASSSTNPAARKRGKRL